MRSLNCYDSGPHQDDRHGDKPIMLRSLKQLLNELVSSPEELVSPLEIEILAGALFVQLAGIDHKVDESETSAIKTLLITTFSLDAATIDDIMQETTLEVEKSTSLFEFTSRINRTCSHEQKYQIVRGLWEIAYADGHLDKYEEHFVRRAAELLYVPHHDFIRAKLEAQPKR